MKRAIASAVLAAFALTARAADLPPPPDSLPKQKEPQCGDQVPPETAVKLCTRLIEFGGLDRPVLAKAYYTRGVEFAAMANHERAIGDFNMALELDPKLQGAHYNRALSLSEKGDHDEAIRDYDVAIKLAPDDPRGYMGRAVEWTAKGDYKRALADYEHLLRLNAKGIEGYFGRGRVRYYAGDFSAAASDFVRAHQIQPSVYTALWLYLARKRADIAGEKTLAQEAGTSGQGDWPAPVVGLFLGSVGPDVVQKAATHTNVTRQRDQRCEANFYIGQWHVLKGARSAAVQLLRDAQTQCPPAFIEHEGAVAELRRLKP